MTCWLCITNGENWNVVKSKKVWGVSARHKNQISRVKPGDILVFYVKQEKRGDSMAPSRVVGIFEAASAPFVDESRIFSAAGFGENERFPYRVRLKPLTIPEEPLEFKPLIPKLKFIRNKNRWSGHLMGKAMREIPEEDYKVIEKAMKEKAGS